MINGSSGGLGSLMENNNTGMLTSLEVMNAKEKVDFIKKLMNIMMIPTMNIMSAISDDKIQMSQLSMIMTVFASIHIDCDLYNLTILEDNVNTKIMEECYKRNAFYMLSSGPVIDKKTGEVCILLDFYKKATTDPLVFLDDVKKENAEILGYLYLKELIGIAQKNYRNKFTLANRARVYLYEHNPNIPGNMRDQAAVSFAKMAMEYHLNSMLIDNFKEHGNSDSYNIRNNIDYIKKSNFVLYSEKYNYKMTHLEILEDLLKDANIEFLGLNESNSNINNQQPQQSSSQPNDNDGNQDDESNEDSSSSKNSGAQNDSNSNNGEEGDDDNHQQSSHSSTNSSGTNNMSDASGRSDNNMNQSNNNSSANTNNQSNTTDNNGSSGGDGLDRNSAYKDEDHEASMLKITFKSNKNMIHFIKMPPKKNNDRYDRLDDESEDVIDQAQDYIDYTISKLKGTGIKDILSKIGCPIEVDMSWEDKIIKYVDDITNISTSHKDIATWAKVNIYTRHITTLPGRKPLPESFPTIYLMFDQSGSMSNVTIRKINYIIQYFYNKKYRVNVFIHDDAQSAEDVKIYEFTSYKKDAFELNQLITSRVKAGGTSHKGVFDVMAQYIEEVKTRGHKKYNSHYVLIASDLYSDIEHIYKNYEWVRLLGKNVIAITESKDIKLPFGQTIVME